jgi:hypothetical protein
VNGFSIQNDLPKIGIVDAEKAFHQSGFPRPVFSHKGMNGTGFNLEGYLIQGVDTGKGFIQIFYLKYIITVSHISTLKRTTGTDRKVGRFPATTAPSDYVIFLCHKETAGNPTGVSYSSLAKIANP